MKIFEKLLAQTNKQFFILNYQYQTKVLSKSSDACNSITKVENILKTWCKKLFLYDVFRLEPTYGSVKGFSL